MDSAMLYSLETELLPLFVTQTLAPSKATPAGICPTPKVPSTAPSNARILVTLLLARPLFATQMNPPSKARPSGAVPTGIIRSTTPSVPRTLYTLLLSRLVTQMLTSPRLPPSLVMAVGGAPIGKVASTAPSRTRNLVIEPTDVTQTLVPSNVMPEAPVTAKVP